MKIIFTALSTSKFPKFVKVEPSGFIFTESTGTIKVITTPCNHSGNASIEDAVGTIAGAINESSMPAEKDRLLLELEIIMDYFKSNEDIISFLNKIFEKVDEEDDWD